ncbi:MAG: bifunctional chorismate mutase/prephenate dehydrogenase [Deltaproteobacteria bacterium]|nr:bifunctional chorismate mutase/prephenate dehydrogenase [Deltaproteobacteria bacterium]
MTDQTVTDAARREQARLAGLRGQIDDLDHQLVELLARRQKVVAEVVAFKKERQLSVYHPAREADMIDRRRRHALKVGLDPDYLEEIFRNIMRYSRSTQTAEISRIGVKPGAKILLVGGGGAMGRLFARWFKASGYEVRILEVGDWERLAALCSGLDMALVSVPIAETVATIARLAPHLPKECILADLTSVKEPTVKAMLDNFSGPVLGFHPMFGPDTPTMERQIMVVTPGRERPENRWPAEQFAAWGGVVVRAAAAEHDEIMAVVQALRHFATFSFGRFLYQRRIDLNRTLEFSSPIYRLELDMVGRLFAQDPELYSEIIFATPERRDLLRNYLESCKNNLEILAAEEAVTGGGRDSFVAEFKEIAKWFGPFSDQAIRESGYLINKLIERF